MTKCVPSTPGRVMPRSESCQARQWTRQVTRGALLCTILLQIPSFVCGAPALGRATFYGNGDGFTLNDGSCACHKRWGWLSNRCESGHCFDYIGQSSAAQSGLRTAVCSCSVHACMQAVQQVLCCTSVNTAFCMHMTHAPVPCLLSK